MMMYGEFSTSVAKQKNLQQAFQASAAPYSQSWEPANHSRATRALINENEFDSGVHGGVQVLGLGEFVFHFNCQGPACWNAVRSFTRVRGAFDFLQGRDSQGRAVRMACLGYVRVFATTVSYVDLTRIIGTLGGFGGFRLFCLRLAQFGRRP